MAQKYPENGANRLHQSQWLTGSHFLDPERRKSKVNFGRILSSKVNTDEISRSICLSVETIRPPRRLYLLWINLLVLRCIRCYGDGSKSVITVTGKTNLYCHLESNVWRISKLRLWRSSRKRLLSINGVLPVAQCAMDAVVCLTVFIDINRHTVYTRLYVALFDSVVCLSDATCYL